MYRCSYGLIAHDAKQVNESSHFGINYNPLVFSFFEIDKCLDESTQRRTRNVKAQGAQVVQLLDACKMIEFAKISQKAELRY
jgi:hypothetical protein